MIKNRSVAAAQVVRKCVIKVVALIFSIVESLESSGSISLNWLPALSQLKHLQYRSV